jgi:predicted GNAT family acetyltransferase
VPPNGRGRAEGATERRARTPAPEPRPTEAHVDGRLAGSAEYEKTEGLIVLTHTEVDGAHEGRGVGSALVRGALDDMRRQGLPVQPVCPFVSDYIGQHPEYADLVHRPPASAAED